MSDANTASAVGLPRRWCSISSECIGGPSSFRLAGSRRCPGGSGTPDVGGDRLRRLEHLQRMSRREVDRACCARRGLVHCVPCKHTSAARKNRNREQLGWSSCVSTTMGPVTTTAGAPPSPWQPALLDLYRSDFVGLVRLAVLVGADRSVAEEIVQDAFVAAHRTWDGVRDPLAYLRRAVVNRCHSWGRRQTLERDRRPAPAPDAALGADELWDALGHAPRPPAHGHRRSLLPRSPRPRDRRPARLPPRHRPHRHPPRPRHAPQGGPPMTDQLEHDLRTTLADARRQRSPPTRLPARQLIAERLRAGDDARRRGRSRCRPAPRPGRWLAGARPRPP